MRTRLDLDRTRDWRDLAYDTATIWLRHAPVFLVLAAIVVAPIVLLEPPALVEQLLTVFVVSELVTALHVVAVIDIGAGRRPSVLRSLRVALRRAPLLIACQVLYVAACIVGLAALIVPGVYLATALAFGPLLVIAEERGPVEALRASHARVAPMWPRVFLLLFFIDLVAPAVGILVGESVVAILVAWTVSASITALAVTLLFFDLRARTAID